MSVLRNAIRWNGWQFAPSQFRPLALEAISRLSPDVVVTPDPQGLLRFSGKDQPSYWLPRSKSAISRPTLTHQSDGRAYLGPRNLMMSPCSFITETQDLLLNSFYSHLTGMCSNSFKNRTGDGPNCTLAGDGDVRQAHRLTARVALEPIARAGANVEA